MFNKWICPASILLEGVNNFDLHNLFLFEGEGGGGGGGGFDPPFLHKFHSNPKPRQREILHSAK